MQFVAEPAVRRRVDGDVRPAHTVHVRLELVERCGSLHREGHIGHVQMGQLRNVIGERRAAGAGVLVVGLEHVVIDDQLASPFEHVEKARGPVRSGRLERRIDLGHRQAPTLRRNRVTSACVCLLGDQQLLAGLSPVFRRHHPWQGRVGMAAHCRCRRHRVPPSRFVFSRWTRVLAERHGIGELGGRPGSSRADGRCEPASPIPRFMDSTKLPLINPWRNGCRHAFMGEHVVRRTLCWAPFYPDRGRDGPRPEPPSIARSTCPSLGSAVRVRHASAPLPRRGA